MEKTRVCCRKCQAVSNWTGRRETRRRGRTTGQAKRCLSLLWAAVKARFRGAVLGAKSHHWTALDFLLLLEFVASPLDLSQRWSKLSSTLPSRRNTSGTSPPPLLRPPIKLPTLRTFKAFHTLSPSPTYGSAQLRSSRIRTPSSPRRWRKSRK
jgi:hypothetical protein